jgi:hypothetical protein
VPSVLRGAKSLPDREALFQHLMRAYVEDRAVSLVEPTVAGSVYYRVMAAEKATRRQRMEATASRAGEVEAITHRKKRRRCKTVVENRKPRTALELKRFVAVKDIFSYSNLHIYGYGCQLNRN